MRSLMRRAVNTKLDEKAWSEAYLPLTAGGINVRRAEDLDLPAFLSPVDSSDKFATGVNGIQDDNEYEAALAIWFVETQAAFHRADQAFTTGSIFLDSRKVKLKEEINSSQVTHLRPKLFSTYGPPL